MRIRRYAARPYQPAYYRLVAGPYIADFEPSRSQWDFGLRTWDSVLDGSPCWRFHLGPFVVGRI